MAEHLRLINPDTSPPATGFALTGAAAEILEALTYVHGLGGDAIAMIAGVPGAGKTTALHQYKQTNPDVVWHTAVAGDSRPWDLACELSEALDIPRPNSRDTSGSRRRIAEAITPERMLVIDEAQNLVQHNAKGRDNLETFEWCRGLAFEGDFPLAFVGHLSLAAAVRDLPQLRRRVKMPVILARLTEDDVNRLAARQGITDAESRAKLFWIARNFGGFADVISTINLACRFAGPAPVTFAHIRAAARQLKLEKGAF